MPSSELPSRARPAPAGLEPEDFDAIREAVMETPRGRWFLDEFSTRLRRAETSSLQDSLRRIESTMASNHDEVMSRLASALRDDDETPTNQTQDAAELPITPRHMKYYRADEDIFEPAPEASIVAAPRLLDMLPLEEPAPAPRRRIFVTRHKPGEAFDVPLADGLPKAS